MNMVGGTNEKEQMPPQPLSSLTRGIQIPRFSLFWAYFEPKKIFYKIGFYATF